MATDVILPALGMAQETGKVVQWLKGEGEQVTKGQPLVEVETDKAIVELESPADGVLFAVTAKAGDDVPVGRVIAKIQAMSESTGAKEKLEHSNKQIDPAQNGNVQREDREIGTSPTPASRLATRIADEHDIDLSLVEHTGKRLQKADVLAYLQKQQQPTTLSETRVLASPKARRLASEGGKDLTTMRGTGPDGAILAADVQRAGRSITPVISSAEELASLERVMSPARDTVSSNEANSALSTTWRIMAERTTQSWTSVPHFFLAREVRANRLIAWRESILKRSSEKVTYTDLLVKIVAVALRAHPYLNATWNEGAVVLQKEVNIGLAVAIDKGLVVPVLQHADELKLHEIAKQRQSVVDRAQTGKLHPRDLQGGTFTISNLGMYGVDTFSAIINVPQAAILAVGRIAERVVPVNGQPSVQPMMTLTLSCDHRVVDGARGAQFLAMLAELIEEPLGLVG